MTMPVQFEVGKTYTTRAIGDSEIIYSFTIISRTPRTIITMVDNKKARRVVSIYRNVEEFRPFGTYSMCATIRAGEPDWSK